MPSISSPDPADDIFTVIKTLLQLRVSSTLAELKEDYMEKVGDNRLPANFKDMRRLLKSIPGVVCKENEYGLEMWEVKKPEIKYMKKSKIPRVNSRPGRGNKRSNGSIASSQGSSIGKVNLQPKRHCNDERNYKPQQRDFNHNVSKKLIDLDGYFHNYQLMGDDFMLSMAKLDLGFKTTKDPETNILSIGYCISGITIKNLARIVRSKSHIDDRVIVYVGAVDIISGRELGDIIGDYYELVSAFRERGIEPKLCTLGPIPGFDGVTNGFNCWLSTRKWSVINIHEVFVGEKGRTLKHYYQKDPVRVSGSEIYHLLWNKIGRSKVLHKLKQHTLRPFNS